MKDEISGVVSFFTTAASAVGCLDGSCELIDQTVEFVNYAKERIGDGGWGDFLMEIAEGMIPPGCVERGWDYCAGYVITTLVVSAASGSGVARLMSKAETILDSTPNVGSRNNTDNDTSRANTVCSARSFGADTGVLLADGTVVPISEIEVGDMVWATDPETGESAAREVEAVWPHNDLLVVLETSAGTVVTTEDHHFWNETDREWEETRDIEFGDTLLSTEGSSVTVVGLDWNATSYGPAFDLTVDETHTYYVTVGDDDTPVLVHNCNGDDNCNCTGAFDIAAYDLADRLTVFHSHPTNDLQRFGGDGVGHNGVTNLSNDDLVRFGGPSGDDPIAGNITFGPDDYPGPASELNITAGNHRIEEIVRRVNNGSMSESTRIRILRSRSGGAI